MGSVKCKNDNSACLPFLAMSPTSSLEHKSATVKNILIVLGRIVEHVNMECHNQE